MPQGADLLPGGYLVAVYAYDRASNPIGVNSNFSVASATPPAVNNTKPGSGKGVAVLDVLEGNVTDKSGTGINRVEVVLKRNSDSLYWTGSIWGARTLLTTTVTGNLWKRTLGLPTGGNLLEGQYTLAVTAFDNAGGSKSTSIFFYVDKTLPTSISIISPANGSSLTALAAINGTATDNAGGTGIRRLDVVLKRNSDAKYWTGTTWGARKLLTVSITGNNWNVTSPMPQGADLPPGGYLVAAYAYDLATNSIGVNSSFTVSAVGASAAPVNLSPVVLSSASADSALGAIRLTFTGGLDDRSATDIDHYSVKRGGTDIRIESAHASAGSNVVIGLADDLLKKGDGLVISYNLLDSKGRIVRGSTRVKVQ
jgi:hypothetical protein